MSWLNSPQEVARRHAAEAIHAAQTAADAVNAKLIAECRDEARAVPTRPCGRCGGKGYAHFLGGSNAPGVCFLCGGDGKRPKSPEDARRLNLMAASIRLQFLRVLWVGYRDAFRILSACPELSDLAKANARVAMDNITSQGRDEADKVAKLTAKMNKKARKVA